MGDVEVMAEDADVDIDAFLDWFLLNCLDPSIFHAYSRVA